MSELQKLPLISEAELAGKGVSALGNRPNMPQQYGVGGLSSNELKQWFDNLGRIATSKLNVLLDTLGKENATDYIKIPTTENAELNTLGDIIRAFYNGVFAASMMKASLPGFFEEDEDVQSVQSIFNKIAASIGQNNEAIRALKTAKKITEAPGADMNESCGVTLDADITIGGVTFPKWAKGSYIVAEQDAVLIVTAPDGTIYTAYRNIAQEGGWTSANIVAKTTQLAYELAKARGYTGTEAEFGALLAALKVIEANPKASATENLTKIGIGGTVYSIQGNGGAYIPEPTGEGINTGIVHYDRDLHTSSFITIGNGLKLVDGVLFISQEYVSEQINSAITEVLNTEVEV